MSSTVKHLYIHVPFCPTKCSYCAFVTHVGSLRLMPDYLRAVELDLERTARSHTSGPLRTIYFGGGTPSMMTPEQAGRLIARAGELFGLDDAAEVTLEAHPTTVSRATLAGFRSAGISRISYGVESLQAVELAGVGREYDVDLIARLVRMSHEVGFTSVALDLMYGLPGQSVASWAQTIGQALSFGADHLSLYPLSVEPRTVFDLRKRRGTLSLPSDEVVVEMYHLACAELHAAGFAHYELSNWARAGHECRHNLACWRNEEYFGVGTGAHAYLKPYRSERVSGVKRYIDCVTAGIDPVRHREEIDGRTAAAETVMLQLRLLEQGLDLDDMPTVERSGEVIDGLVAQRLVRIEGTRVRLTESAVPVANEVIRLLM